MSSKALDRESLREAFVYLYRCWIQRDLGEVPRQLALSPDDAFLLSQSFALYANTQPIQDRIVADLRSRVNVPILFIAPSFPAGVLGVSDLRDQLPGEPAWKNVLRTVQSKLEFLDKHTERGLSSREAYNTDEWGQFSIWKAKKATRLLFQPEAGELHGYAVIKNGPKDFFFRKSKSCKEEGTRSASGTYKRCQHRIESRSLSNFDLIYDSGEVLLLHLTLAGAGYKVFPRQTFEPEPNFP